METGDKNRDDFHCMEMSLVMRMQFISAMTEMTHVSLAMTLFSSNGGLDFRVIMHDTQAHPRAG